LKTDKIDSKSSDIFVTSFISEIKDGQYMLSNVKYYIIIILKSKLSF